ncbi:MAG: hypothetical protein Q9181_008002, partial [Wetmoreana brouardii]
ALMARINRNVGDRLGTSSDLHPHQIFKLVAGTSTGGLIALMIGKMGMTIAECIEKYEKLSKVIFGKKHMRARVTRGLAPARYSGKTLQKCIQGLLRERKLDEDLSMSHEADRVACLPCNDNVICNVCDAARATSAAPTFFPVMTIQNRFFADGGLAHNNPSFAIFFHYTRDESKKRTGRTTADAISAPAFSRHGDLDCSRVRFTNIGTGARRDEVEPGKRDRLLSLLPGVIRKVVFLKQTLTEIATSSEVTADMMRVLERMNDNLVMYERLDANHGVSNIKLDDHNALGEIRRKTDLYLAEQETIDLLAAVGSAIAGDYFDS